MCFDSAQAKAVKIKYVFRQRPSQGCKNPIRLISSKHESLIIQLTKVPTGEEENEKKDNETAYNKQTNKQTNKGSSNNNSKKIIIRRSYSIPSPSVQVGDDLRQSMICPFVKELYMLVIIGQDPFTLCIQSVPVGDPPVSWCCIQFCIMHAAFV